LPVFLDLLALVFLLTGFGGLLTGFGCLLTGFGGLLTDFGGLSALDIANTRARLKNCLLLADFLPFRFLDRLQDLASTGFLLADFELFLAVRAWT